jgi:uncharacterized protein
VRIREKIKRACLELAGDVRITDVRIGLGYTAVLLESGRLGVAYTFRNDLRGGCKIFRGLRPLSGSPASRVLELFDSQDKVESAVALATANALLNHLPDSPLDGDVLEHVSFRPDDRVGMVGYFAPMVPAIRERAASLIIFEQTERLETEVLPEEEMFTGLPECQVAIVTATSILNDTIDEILYAAHTCREVVLLGASTPMFPTAFAGTPLTVLSGVLVTSPEKMLQVVSEGGGTRSFRGSVRKINIRLA